MTLKLLGHSMSLHQDGTFYSVPCCILDVFYEPIYSKVLAVWASSFLIDPFLLLGIPGAPKSPVPNLSSSSKSKTKVLVPYKKNICEVSSNLGAIENLQL